MPNKCRLEKEYFVKSEHCLCRLCIEKMLDRMVKKEGLKQSNKQKGGGTMKLTNMQTQAIVRTISDNIGAKNSEIRKKFYNNPAYKKIAKDAVAKIKSLPEIPRKITTQYRPVLEDEKGLEEEIAYNEWEKVSKDLMIPCDKRSIEDEITLASIDCKTLDELKAKLAKTGKIGYRF